MRNRILKSMAVLAVVAAPAMLLMSSSTREAALLRAYPQLRSSDFTLAHRLVFDPMSGRKANLDPRYQAALEELYQLRTQALSDNKKERLQASAKIVVTEAKLAAARPPRESADDGLTVEAGTILVLFGENVSASAIQKTLRRHGLTPRAAFLDIGFFVTDTIEKSALTPEAEGIRLRAIVEKLKEEEDVTTAVQNAFIQPTVSTRPAQLNNICWDFYSPGCDAVEPFRRTHFPEAWNLLDAAPGRVRVGVLDVGFNLSHPDLAGVTSDPRCGTHTTTQRSMTHGNSTTGIIAAGFNNGGIDGAAAPVVSVITCMPKLVKTTLLAGVSPQIAAIDRAGQSFSAVIDGLRSLLRSGVPLVNVSMGYNWSMLGVTASTNPVAQAVVEGQGLIVRRELRANPNAVVVASAGNDGGQPALWSSPFNWATLGPTSPKGDAPVENVIVVEATDLNGGRLPISNTGGTIAAIGAQIGTANATDFHICPPSTSCAAPMVTATVALMRAYNPTLTVPQLRTALGITGATAMTPQLDAFTAMKAAHRLRSNADLANLVPNGTTVIVDRNDFLAFKSAFRQVQFGPLTDDLNRDRDRNANDNRFCRQDLNGDGNVDENDLDVIVGAWSDPTVNRVTLRAALLTELSQP